VSSTDDTSPTETAEVTSLIAQLQSEHAGFKAEMAIKVASLEDTITGLAHENALLKRRLYGNKTERSLTSELQLALGDLLAGQQELQKELAKQLKEATDAAPPEPDNGDKPRARGRRDLALLESKLPRVVVEITEAHLEQRGCRRVGFEDSRQLGFRPGGYFIVVKRVAKYEVTSSSTTNAQPDAAAKADAAANDDVQREAAPVADLMVAAAAVAATSSTADRITTVVTTPSPETLFPKGLLHTSAIAHLLVSKFALGTPHYRLEQALADQGVPLDRGLMCRYVEHAGNTLGATIVAAMWRDATANAGVISTVATGALIQPTMAKDGKSLAC
jgi:transposase